MVFVSGTVALSRAVFMSNTNTLVQDAGGLLVSELVTFELFSTYKFIFLRMKQYHQRPEVSKVAMDGSKLKHLPGKSEEHCTVSTGRFTIQSILFPNYIALYL